MTYGKQQLFRFLFPGFAVAFGVAAFFSRKSPAEFIASFELSLKSIGAPIIAAVAIGALYWPTGVAKRFRRWTFRRTGGRINQRLCDIAAQHGVAVFNPTDSQFKVCLENSWYRIIDNDEQLSKKSEAIRLNGTIATSSLELTFVAAAFAAAFCIRDGFGAWFAAFVVCGLVALFVWRKSRGHHVQLVDEQIDIAQQHFSADITSAVRRCETPGSRAQEED